MTGRRLVHIVDDEPVIRESTAALLVDAGYDVQCWPLGTDFVGAAAAAAPGCVLLDYRMPDMDGLAVQRALADAGVRMPVIMLTAHGDIAMAVTCMKAGAVDFLEKPFRRAALLAAIGEAFGHLDAWEDAPAASPAALSLLASLSQREREVLHGLARGFSNKIIARNLEISPRTVEIHRARLMAKLKVNTLSGALRIAFAAEPALRG